MDSFKSLPSLRDIIHKHELSSKKSLGQNFITDTNLLDKIARSSGDISNSVVVEIGPGPGGLTRALLANGAKKVFAIEKDSRCIYALQSLVKAADGRLEIIEEDALEINIKNLAGDSGKIKIIANLPYNVATPLLLSWLDNIDVIESMVLMFQKEVAERITADPGSKAFGRLSVACQFLCECRVLFDIPPQAFIPQPKITSSLISIKPYTKIPFQANRKTLETICRATFGQRRKTLRVSLRQLTDDSEKLLAMAEIDSSTRPEDLSLDQFCRLARCFDELSE